MLMYIFTLTKYAQQLKKKKIKSLLNFSLQVGGKVVKCAEWWLTCGHGKLGRYRIVMNLSR